MKTKGRQYIVCVKTSAHRTPEKINRKKRTHLYIWKSKPCGCLSLTWSLPIEGGASDLKHKLAGTVVNATSSSLKLSLVKLPPRTTRNLSPRIFHHHILICCFVIIIFFVRVFYYIFFKTYIVVKSLLHYMYMHDDVYILICINLIENTRIQVCLVLN
jgi:hypothetical protein